MKKDEKPATIFAPTKGGRFAQHVVEKMFKAVGRVWSPEITGTPDWFLKTSWTTEQQEAFCDWMVKEGMRRMRWRKRRAVKETQWFLFDCGWTTDPKEPDANQTSSAAGTMQDPLPAVSKLRSKARRSRPS
jgi:hypothetical protein